MRIKNRSTVYLYSISVCMGSLILGYSLTSYSNIAPLIPQHNYFQSTETYINIFTLLSGLNSLFAIFGAIISTNYVNTFGYYLAFKYLDIITIIVSVVAATSLSIFYQFVSRLMIGVIVGLNTVMVPTYLTSVLPGSMGGPAGTLNQLFITIGILTGIVFGYFMIEVTLTDVIWRYCLAFPAIAAAIRIYALSTSFPFDSVQEMIQYEDQNIDKYVKLIYEDTTVLQFINSRRKQEMELISENAPFLTDLARPYRHRIIVASFLVFFNLFSGNKTSWAIISSNILTPYNDGQGWSTEDQISNLAWLGFLQVFFTFLAGQFLQKYGRKTFLLQGLRVLIVCNIAVVIMQAADMNFRYIQNWIITIHVIVFSLSFGPCSFLVATELLEDITVPTVIFWIFNFIIELKNQYLIFQTGLSVTYLWYSLVSVVGLVYLANNLIQTQGKSRQQVSMEYRQMERLLPFYWRRLFGRKQEQIVELQPKKLWSMNQQRGSQ